MRHIRLKTIVDEYDSTPGFIMAGTPDFEGIMADRDGGLIAHDLIEHQNGVAGMGPVWDELEALGGIWYVRGQWGDMLQRTHSFHTPYANVGSDISRMFRDWIDGTQERYPGCERTRPSDYDDDFNECIAHGRKDILAEYTDEGNGSPGEDEHGRDADWYDLLEQYLALTLHCMRTGFRKAKRRFEARGHSQWNAQNLFLAVRDAVGDAAKQIEWEGQEFRLSYGDQEARCVAIYDGESYE